MPGDVTARRLVGRRDELLELAGLAAADSPHAVVLEGEPGMGKTMLVAAASTLLRESATVVTAVPAEGDQRVPWATVSMLAPELGIDEFDVDAEAPDAATRAQFAFANAFGSVADRAAAAGRPLVVVIDDAQWVDPASAGALSFASRARASWLVARRAREQRGFVPETGRLVHLELGPMHARDLDELVRDLTGEQWPGVQIDQLAELSGGNPLYASQLVELFGTPTGLVVTDLPEGALGAFAQRVDRLEPAHHRVLGAMALRRRPHLTGLDTVLQADWHSIETALDAAERAGVVTVRLPAVDFAHALARQAVIDRLDVQEAADLHRRLADIADDSIDRAWHLGQGVIDADASVAAEMERTGQRALEMTDPLLGSQLLVRAVELTPSGDSTDRLRRTYIAGRAANLAGDWATAELLLTPVIRSGGADLAATSARRSYIVVIASLHGAKAALEAAEVVLPLAGSTRERIDLMDMRTRLAMLIDLGLAERMSTEQLESARSSGTPDDVRAARVVVDELRMLRGEPIEMGEYVAAAGRGWEAFGRGWTQSQTAFAELLQFHDHHELAIEMWRQRIEHAEQQRDDGNILFSRDKLAESLRLSGDWNGVAQLVAEHGRAVTGDHPDNWGRPDTWVLFLWAGTGRHTLVELLVERQVESVTLAVPPVRLEVLNVCGFALLAAGRADRAAELLRAARATALEWGYADMRGLNYHTNLTEALVAVGQLDEAEVVAADAERIAGQSRWPFNALEAERCRALVLVATGKSAEAMRLLDASEPGWSAIRRPFEVARAYLLLAEARRLTRHPARARQALDRAESMFAELGAQPWIDRVTAVRDLLGSHGRARVEPDELTELEVAVVELVRAGHSTPDVARQLAISLRNAESQLTRIYRKLGVRNRGQLLALDESALAAGRSLDA